MKFSELIKNSLSVSRKATPEEQLMFSKIPEPGSYNPTISAIVSNEQKIPVKLTPEQIRYNINMKLYGRPIK